MYAFTVGSVRPYFLTTVLVVNIWAYFDAIIRYPSVPQLESVFCLKLLASVVVKTVAYSIGFLDIHKWALLFLSALFLNVWLLPVLYVLAVPYGDPSPFRKDRDLLHTLLLLVIDRRERVSLWESISRPVCQIPLYFPRHTEILTDKTWI